MTDRKFNAILAKNIIAREVIKEEMNVKRIISCLKDIEDYLGEGNQPSVEDIVENNTKN